MTETKEIKMPPKQMFSVLVMQHGLPWVYFIVAGVAALILTGFIVDFRFFLLALIWLFLIAPLTMVFLYFYFGMQPLTAFNVIPHTVFFSDSDFSVRISENEDESQENIEQQENKGAVIQNSKEYKVSYRDIIDIKSGPDYVLLITEKQGWMWLPMNAFVSSENFNQVLKKIRS